MPLTFDSMKLYEIFVHVYNWPKSNYCEGPIENRVVNSKTILYYLNTIVMDISIINDVVLTITVPNHASTVFKVHVRLHSSQQVWCLP